MFLAWGPECVNQPAYQVVARRYRPQQFQELVGQEHVAQALAGAIAQGRVGHAYLFTGARGVGKTSTARILAKALNCVRGPTDKPCGQCDICQAVARGEDVDVLEIDGASNRGIDEIRQLRQNVSVRPSRARFKIYIIDEVHMLTREAFNALLKTLEEPPEHVKFIFCTTEPEKLPATVLSRCQRFDFAGIRPTQIAQRLRQIAQSEQVEVEQAALELLARRAAGSMRDAQSLLEQVLSTGEKRITAQLVHRLLGTAAGGEVLELLHEVLAGRAKEALQRLQHLLGQGADTAQVMQQLVAYLRDVLVVCVGAGPELFQQALPEEAPQVEQLASQCGPERTLAMLQIADQALARMRQVTYRQVVAEAALVRMALLPDLDQLAQAISRVQSGQAVTPAGGTAAAAQAAGASSPTTGKKKPPVALAVDRAEEKTSPPAVRSAPQESATVPMASAAVDAQTVWQRVVQAVQDAGLLAQMARSARTVELQGNRLVVRFASGHRASCQFCEQPAHRARLESLVRKHLGPQAVLELVVDQEEQPSGSTARGGQGVAALHQLRREAFAHPWVQKAAELFDAVPSRVDPPPGQ